MRPSLLTILLPLAGCFSAVEHFQDTTMERAAFEMGCAKDQLQVVELVKNQQVGVTGCGKKLVYVMAPNGAWILNSDASPAPEAPPAAKPEAPGDQAPSEAPAAPAPTS